MKIANKLQRQRADDFTAAAVEIESSALIVSFIIPALNEQKHLPRCLASIHALALPPDTTVEVIVVDNQSTDDTVAIAEQMGCTVLEVEPGRPSRARNKGVRESTGQWLGFVDADCELPTDWLMRFAEHFKDDAVLAGGSDMAAPLQDAPWVEHCWYALAFGADASNVEKVPWLASYNLLVKREAFDRVEGFDESLITCEDADLGYKLAEHGQLVLDHSVRTRHHGESKTLLQFFRREAWRGRGSLRSLFGHRFNFGELPSILVPVAFAGAIVLGLVGCGLALFGQDHRWGYGGAVLLGLAAALPALIVVKKGAVRRFIGCWTLMSSYLLARAVGLFWPMPRVGR